MKSDSGSEIGGLVGCTFMILLGLVQIYAGWVGISYHIGYGWAAAALAAAVIFRFTLPLTIGSFFCARDVWDWHWLGALLFAAPGLALMALMIPGALAALLKGSRE
ncbi:MAG TPA: hypothetical protein ENJ06_02005 [Phycisphaeraceae bacterium]|nr:hypothetical protein [Phycisphaeraceae bacterium]